MNRTLAAAALCFGSFVCISCGESEPCPPAGAAAGPMKPMSQSGFVVRWGLPAVPAVVAPNQKFAAAAIVENAGDQAWLDPRNADTSGTGAGSVRLGYRWLPKAEAGAPPAEHGPGRGELFQPLPPGGTTVMAVEVVAPATPGEYRLQLDLCQELVSWFDVMGADKLIVPISVK